MSLKIYFDGGCRPNPGPMETAVVARGLTYLDQDLGSGDNNDAEWLALLHALRVALSIGAPDIILVGDSASVVAQANTRETCHTVRLEPQLRHFRELAAQFDRVRVRQVGRSQNLAGIVLERLHSGR